MGIPFLLALSISSRRANSLLHFLKCVLSRPVPPCFFLILYQNFHTKDLLTRLVFEKVGKEGTSSCSRIRTTSFSPITFLSDIGLLPLYFSKFMFKSKIINIMKNKQR
ncbi:hypothetical protein H5410_059932 [Solanum commersonii]|uniref:Uncharacterized protein n=1 Tax=Solanum commersonii TaxID=4109 RepID=A0A9J5W4Z9_SOLCO|nr:hypothetical protein H5410_059932 [Solanum commersonii]